MSNTTMMVHVDDGEKVSTVVRDDGNGPYARLHVGADLVVFARGPELLRMHTVIADALDELAAGRGYAVFETEADAA